MSPLKPSRNLAARMGRWSASHWKTATFGWLALVVAAVFIGGQVGTKNLDPQKSGSGESGRVDRISADEFKRNKQEMILIQSRTEVATDPAFVHTIQDATRTLAKLPIVVNVHSPLVGAYENQISSDRHSALVQFELDETDTKKAQEKVAPVEAAVAKLAARHPSLRVEQFGDASANKALDAVFSHDLKKAGELSLPITLAILVAAFGALVAAGIPLLLALTAVFLTMGLVALPSHLIPLDKDISAVILLVGLAVGVDYTMFYLKAGARGACRRQEPGGGARGRGRDLGPRRDRLRHDRDDRDGWDVLRRRQDVQRLRPRDDPRRRQRRARLGHRPAGAALPARRQGRQGPRALRPALHEGP